MAQLDAGEKLQETPQMEVRDSTSVSFKFNAQAPEFVPRSQTQMPISGYICPYFQFLGGGDGGGGGSSGVVGSDWLYFGNQEQIQLFTNPNVGLPSYSKNVLTNDLQKKIIKQVLFSVSGISNFFICMILTFSFVLVLLVQFKKQFVNCVIDSFFFLVCGK